MRQLAALLSLCVIAAPLSAQARPPRDTLSDSARAILRDVNREAGRMGRAAYDSARKPVNMSDEVRSSAFADPQAKVILERARVARLSQDSALRSYRAIATQRMSLGLGVRRVGLEKTLFRGDNVARVDWSRDGGVWVTPLGSRATVPMAGANSTGDMVDAVSIPYFPGRESLWMPSSNFGVVRADVDDREIIHPIANGAEAYYRYETGDSITITLDRDRNIRLRELRITARRPEWRVFVGTFWFDQESGQLVRAAYRLAVPIEFWDIASEEIGKEEERNAVVARTRDSLARERLSRAEYVIDSTRRAARSSTDDDEPPGWVKAAFRPARGTLDYVTIEYGLYGGRFWMPRANSAEFHAQVGPMRTPFKLDEKFTYDEVNGDYKTPPIPKALTALERLALNDSIRKAGGDTSGIVMDRDPGVTISVGVGGGDDSVRMARRDSAFRRANCKEGDSTYVRTESRYNDALRIAYNMPCDRQLLRNSELLPPSNISDDDLFDMTTRDQLLDALGLSLQPAWGPLRPTFRSGLDLVRYNRVEGLSVGVLGEQVLGAGYTARATARLGHADLEVNGELGIERSNGRRTAYATVYRRLRATAPEWGNPLSFGPSVPAILFARDEGFYFRTVGVEVGDRRTVRKGAFEWRLFTEQQRTAGDSSVVDTWSLGRQLGVGQFRTNFDASKLSVTGLEASWGRVFGNDPLGLRVVSTLRGEGGTGTVAYGRGSFELLASRPVRNVAVALTTSAGTSVGDLPPQRGWFLGGLRTVRGSAPGSQFGSAYWFARGEVGTKFGGVRPVLFYDGGWAGSRDAFGKGAMLRGAGGGLSFLDGIFRLDVARNLARRGGWRTDLYFEAPI
jgi:hypothetical protein